MRKNKNNTLTNGLIYTVIDKLITLLIFLNLVELIKVIFKKIISDKNIGSKQGTDIFIITKWVFIIILFKLKIQSVIITSFVWYLIIANVFTYFNYHVWKIDNGSFDSHRIKRRFITLTLAIFFNILCFTFLIRIPYFEEFSWSKNNSLSTQAISCSFSNTLALGCEKVKPISEFADSIIIIQTSITFIFLTIILSNSIPQQKE